MRKCGVFTHHIDFGQLGELECRVEWHGYRPAVEAEDDRTWMEPSIYHDFGNGEINLSNALRPDEIAIITEKAWQQFPCKVDAIEERNKS